MTMTAGDLTGLCPSSQDDDMAMLSFTTDSHGNICSNWKGKRVYPAWDHEGVISPGESWCCMMELNPKNGGNYFATPIRKIDSSFLTDLGGEQLERIAECLLTNHRDEVLDAIGGRVIMDAAPVKAVDHPVSPSHGSDPAEDAPAIVHDGCPGIYYDGSDSLRSQLFDDGYYAVLFSKDRRNLVIRPDRRGYACVGGTLTVHGISGMLRWTPGERRCAHRSEDGSIAVAE